MANQLTTGTRPGSGFLDTPVVGAQPWINRGRVTPPPPFNLQISFSNNTLIVSFREPRLNQPNFDYGINDWSVRYCAEALAGDQTAANNAGMPWPSYVLRSSRELISVPYKGGDGLVTVSYSAGANLSGSVSSVSQAIGDGYIIVVAETDFGFGQPTFPYFCQFSGNLAKIPSAVTSPTITITEDPPPNVDNPVDLKIVATYFPPADAVLNEFKGMRLMVTGYNGSSVVQEIGSMSIWDGTMQTQTVTYKLPMETGLGNGVATFTNSNATVAKVSGDNFAAPWNGRLVLVKLSATSYAPSYLITGVTPTTSMTISPVWAGSTANYTYKVLNNMTFYFVSVGLNGGHNPYLSAPTVVI